MLPQRPFIAVLKSWNLSEEVTSNGILSGTNYTFRPKSLFYWGFGEIDFYEGKNAFKKIHENLFITVTN